MNAKSLLIRAALGGLAAVPLQMVACSAPSARPGNDALTEIDPAIEYARRQRREALEAYQRAAKLHADGEYERALEVYRQALDLDDQLYAAWNNMGQLLMLKGNYSDAVGAYQIAAELEPTDPRPVYNIGLAYQQVGWAQDAHRSFDMALERDKNYIPALRGLVRSAELAGMGDRELLAKIKRAMLIENEEEWREYFLGQSFRVQAMVNIERGRP